MDQDRNGQNGHEEQTPGFEDKLRRAILAGIGVVADTVEKSRDAIASFTSKENIQTLAEKGEQTFEQVLSFGVEAIDKVKKTWTGSDIANIVKTRSAKIRSLAEDVHSLPPAERKVFDELLAYMDSEGGAVGESMVQSDEGDTVPKPSCDCDSNS